MFANSGGLSAAMPEVCVINWRIVIGTPVGFVWPLTWTRENSGKNLASGSSSRSFPSSTRSSAPKTVIGLLIERMSKINRYDAELFSKYLAKLKAVPDGDGSLLDHMTILYGAGLSNSNGHSGDNLPQMLVGGHAGKIRGGRHIKYADKPSQANLLMTIMHKMDYPVEKVGGSTGELPVDVLSEV